jgi:hypothetical protein
LTRRRVEGSTVAEALDRVHWLSWSARSPWWSLVELADEARGVEVDQELAQLVELCRSELLFQFGLDLGDDVADRLRGGVSFGGMQMSSPASTHIRSRPPRTSSTPVWTMNLSSWRRWMCGGPPFAPFAPFDLRPPDLSSGTVIAPDSHPAPLHDLCAAHSPATLVRPPIRRNHHSENEF